MASIPLSPEAGTHSDNYPDVVRACRNTTACMSALIFLHNLELPLAASIPHQTSESVDASVIMMNWVCKINPE